MRKHFDAIALGITALTVAIAVAFANGESLGIRSTVDADAEAHSDDAYFTENDLDGSWDASHATRIVLEGDDASIQGSGAYAWDGSVTIANSGAYVVSGTLDDGSLTVDANANSKVWILLDGVQITNDTDACVIIDQADKVFLTLAEGSTNALTSGDSYSSEALEDNTDGTIFAHDDLTINGSGSLVVTAGYKHGISANDDLVIAGGNLVVDAPKDGVHANDSMRLCGLTLDVTAGDDGLAVDNEEGYLYLESGDITIQSADEGMVAPGDVTIAGGSLTIETGTEQGHHGVKAGGTCTIGGGTVLVSACYEGISAPYIDVTGGDLTVYPTDDGLNASAGGSAGGMGMGGGPGGGVGGMRGGAEGGPDGMRGQGRLGGMRGEPGGGDATSANDQATAADGGKPANGQAQERVDGAGMAPEASLEESGGDIELPWIHMSDGTVTVINDSGRDADGLDSNGDIIITGGDIRVSLLGDGSNSAIDYGSESGGVCEISGGTVVACGGSSMAEGFDSSSSQCSLLYNLGTGAEAGTNVSLRDASGSILLSYDAPCSFTSVNLSCPQMVLGKTYTVAIGNTAEKVTLSEVALSSGDTQGGKFGGGYREDGGMQQDVGGKGGGRRGGFGDGDTPLDNATFLEDTFRPRGGFGGPLFEEGTDTPESQDDVVGTQGGVRVTELPTETLMLCGASVLVLAFGLLVVILFRGH